MLAGTRVLARTEISASSELLYTTPLHIIASICRGAVSLLQKTKVSFNSLKGVYPHIFSGPERITSGCIKRHKGSSVLYKSILVQINSSLDPSEW